MQQSEAASSRLAGNQDSLARNSLERIRQRLVDTSARNRLINCRLDRPQVIRLVDELPDQVYQRLAEGKPFTIEPVPAPTQQELLEEGYIRYDEETGELVSISKPQADVWARRHGINTDYDLPGGLEIEGNPRHNDGQLQTLLFPDGLNTRLSKLSQLARTAMEESGTNILYLALGFLEWFESPSSNTQRLSPLFVVPVELTRGKRVDSDGMRTYQLTLRDDGLFNNVSLSQRLLQDFALELPAVTDDSVPEDYFTAISRTLSRSDSRWKVRRYAALCLLDFTKQLMYEDLDPARWPAGSNLVDHPLLQQFLNAGETAPDAVSNGPVLTEHAIDGMQDIHERFPLIYEADSSQHSALIDVVNRQNLVIEGPPGTGKSQTITNLIAACINQGLSVLFVAEKLAALEVVKRRLDQAGLGDFCLEVHSHKSSKLAILGSLMDSHNRRSNVTPPDALLDQVCRFENAKNRLHDYAEKLNQPWQETGLSPHQILQRATDYADRTPLSAGTTVVHVDCPSRITDALVTDTLDAAERLQTVFEAVSRQVPDADIAQHPWFGVRNASLAGAQRQTLIDALSAWTAHQQAILAQWSRLQTTLQIDPIDAPDQLTLIELMSTLENLPHDLSESVLARVDELREHREALDTISERRQSLRQRFSSLRTCFNDAHLLSPARASAATQALTHIRDHLGLTDTASLSTVGAHAQQLVILQERITAVHQDSQTLHAAMPAEFKDIGISSINGLKALTDVLDIASRLPHKLWRYRDGRYADARYLPALDDIEPQVLALRPLKTHLSERFNLENLPRSRSLEDIHRVLENGGLFGILKAEFRQARQTLTLLCRPGITTAQATEGLADLCRYQQGMEALADTERRNPILGTTGKSLDSNLKAHRLLANWYQAVRQRFNGRAVHYSPKAEALFNLDTPTADHLVALAASDLAERAVSVQGSIEKLKNLYPGYFSSFDNDRNLLDSDTGLAGLVSHLNDCLSRIADSVREPDQSLSDLIAQASRWSSTAQDHLHWTESDAYSRFVPSLISISAHPDHDDARAMSTLANAQCVARLASESSLFLHAMRKEPTLAQLERLRDSRALLMSALDAATSAQDTFHNLGDVEADKWLKAGQSLAQAQARNQCALQQPTWLDTWLSYQRVKRRRGTENLQPLMQLLERGELPAAQTQLAIKADLYQQLATHIMHEDEELADFDGNEMQAIRQQFQKYDKALLTLQRQQIAANCSRSDVPSGNNRGAVATHTEFSLIQREAAKRKRHIAIRSLMKRAPRAIQSLKPCFMMSPMSVAQYLEPGQYKFDVIVMDEASQIRPEEALGAIARAQQLVVVGDPKQLPPTSFFSRMASDDDQDDEEAVGLERSESILDAVMPVFPTRRLRWHYRSRHESLIAFSNQKFYDSDLVLFPSPYKVSTEFGINFTPLKDATYSNSVNAIEAQRVLDILARQLMQHPDESVGVVAMNIRQRDELEAQWEKRLASDNLLQKAAEKNQETDEPLFLKNLENVQGDERDVIIISMTYGPEVVGGVTHQRFGPINSDVGWRRLNVLLTRSKKRMEVVSSMGSGDVRSDQTSSRGVQSLRALLEYCETGHLNSTIHTGRAADSAFEIAVMRKLAARGYTCEPQVGVAGFFIDLAVRNPHRPGEFLMGIECDGATYHSAKSARDRDRLRQEVLENLGWTIRRVWSTDWFRNADAQLQPIVAELDKLAQKQTDTIADHDVGTEYNNIKTIQPRLA